MSCEPSRLVLAYGFLVGGGLRFVGRSLRFIGPDEAQLLFDLELDLGRDVGILGEEGLGVLAPLAELVVAVDEPGPRFARDAVLDGDVEEAALLGNAAPVLDVELGLAEGGRDLVLDHLDANPRAHDLGTVLERVDTTNVEPDGRVELERAPTGGGLW